MTNLPKDLPQRLRKAGLKVIVVGDDWQRHGRPASTGGFAPVGALNHHTGAYDGIGDAAQDLAYAKWMFFTGRPDDGLPAPLCQIALAAEGVVYLGAGGRANHAGTARPSGSVAGGDGNRLYVGIEWMLSGTQPIPEKMMKAGATLNAVLLEVLGTSEQTVSCHYNTSVTGKWDIGDPDGVAFSGHKVLDIAKFRRMVKAEKLRLRKPPRQDRLVKFGHISMQYSDDREQQLHDAHLVMGRKYDILTGTEAGPGGNNALRQVLRSEAKEHDYKLFIPRHPTDTWVAVKRQMVADGWKTKHTPVIPGSAQVGSSRKFGPKGLTTVAFDTVDLGRFNVGCSHYLTGGSKKGKASQHGKANHFALNRELAEEIGAWGRRVAKGNGLGFYGGDQNIVDRFEDTFFGQPFTSCWDELEKWPGTGHGNIDVIASYDPDLRVECVGARVLKDSKLFLNTDHYLVEAEYRVRLQKGSAR